MSRIVSVAAVVMALVAVGCGDEGPEGDEIVNFTVSDLTARPPITGERVGLEGVATPVPDGGGFILSDDGAAVYVAVDPDDDPANLEQGQEIRVVGTVRRIGQQLSNRLSEALNADEDPRPEVNSPAEAIVQTDSGSLYVALDSLEPLGDG